MVTMSPKNTAHQMVPISGKKPFMMMPAAIISEGT